ncbi:potassium channel family protein [Kaistella carnis]|uniref:potassium channel family protein n=1 Tax=Kaistella carnis TaxID=1241979 RepID=UPI00289FD953|nr:potassium channel family protein [Kaistella carnis]
MITATAKSFFSKKRYRYLIYATTSVLFIGVLGFRLIEHWRWIDCLNYAVSTMVTTGNAGVIPKTDVGKMFNVFYMFTSVILILFFVNTISRYFHEMRKTQEIKYQRHKDMVEKHISNDGAH